MVIMKEKENLGTHSPTTIAITIFLYQMVLELGMSLRLRKTFVTLVTMVTLIILGQFMVVQLRRSLRLSTRQMTDSIEVDHR
jgi:hypothetical protein